MEAAAFNRKMPTPQMTRNNSADQNTTRANFNSEASTNEDTQSTEAQHPVV